jgi:hypothetical protein
VSARQDMRRLRKAMGATSLENAPVEALLLHAVTAPSDDPLEGLLGAMLIDARAAAMLAEGAEQVVAEALEGFVRRLETGVELRRRELLSRSGTRTGNR